MLKPLPRGIRAALIRASRRERAKDFDAALYV